MSDEARQSSAIEISRRTFIAATLSSTLTGCKVFSERDRAEALAEPIIDIHQHTHYSGRSNADLVQHQRKLGVTTTVLLPAGRHYGLEAQCGGNESVQDLAKKHPGKFRFFANELPYLKETDAVIRANLNQGAIG